MAAAFLLARPSTQPAGEPSGQDASAGGQQEKGTWTTPGEGGHVLQKGGGIASVEPGRRSSGLFRGLPDQFGGDPRLVGGLRHRMQLIRERAEAGCCLSLLAGSLATELRLCLAEEVRSLRFGVGCDAGSLGFCCLGDSACGVSGLLRRVQRPLPGSLLLGSSGSGRWIIRVLRPFVLCHHRSLSRKLAADHNRLYSL
jgi:hypothetical protein